MRIRFATHTIPVIPMECDASSLCQQGSNLNSCAGYVELFRHALFLVYHATEYVSRTFRGDGAL